MRTYKYRSVIILSISALVLFLLASAALPPASAESNTPTSNDMIITGVIVATLTSSRPKAVEVCVINPIADLSIYGIGSANNGNGSDGQEFTFPAVSASAGNFIYIASESTEFNNWFGFAPDHIALAVSVSGNDAIELFENGTVIDTFGEINVNGNGEPWDYSHGWAYRTAGTPGAFILADWSFSSPHALDGESDNATATTPFPNGTFPCAATAVALASTNATTTTSYTALTFASMLVFASAGLVQARKK